MSGLKVLQSEMKSTTNVSWNKSCQGVFQHVWAKFADRKNMLYEESETEIVYTHFDTEGNHLAMRTFSKKVGTMKYYLTERGF